MSFYITICVVEHEKPIYLEINGEMKLTELKELFFKNYHDEKVDFIEKVEFVKNKKVLDQNKTVNDVNININSLILYLSVDNEEGVNFSFVLE
jgi:hypothetical protein